jgi:hypothetical protein
MNKASPNFIVPAALGCCIGAIARALVLYPPQHEFIRLVLVISLMILGVVSGVIFERQ